MDAKLQKWGNSNGIRIPKEMLVNLGLETDDLVDLVEKEDVIIISKKKKHYTIEERIEDYNKSNKGNCEEKSEVVDWGDPKGQEIW